MQQLGKRQAPGSSTANRCHNMQEAPLVQSSFPNLLGALARGGDRLVVRARHWAQAGLAQRGAQAGLAFAAAGIEPWRQLALRQW